MITRPTNDELQRLLHDHDPSRQFTVAKRDKLDQNPFAYLEKVFFEEDPHYPYVLKSVVPYFQNELVVHEFVNSYPINAANLFFRYTDPQHSMSFLVMDWVDITGIYQYPSDEAEGYYYEAAAKLADLHVHSHKKWKHLRKKHVRSYGTQHYQKVIIPNVKSRLRELSEEENGSTLLSLDLVEAFENSIDATLKMFDPFKKTKLALCHGDFDIGNLFVTPEEEVVAIDWGMGHLDAPMIDIAQLVNCLGDFSISVRRDIFSEYFEAAQKLYPKKIEPHFIRVVGTLMHILYFLDFQLYAVNEMVEPSFFLQQIHDRVEKLVNLLKTDYS